MSGWASRRRGAYGRYGDAGLSIGRRVFFHLGYGDHWSYGVTLGPLFVAVSL